MSRDGRFFSNDEMFAQARAKIVAQEAKLARMLPSDPQRKTEERVLRSMLQNASITHMVLALDRKR